MEHGEALDMLERAYSIRVRAAGGGGADDAEARELERRIAASALAAGDGQAAEGKHEEALKLYERALDVNRRLFGESSEEVATAAACVEVSAASSAARARAPEQRLRLWRRAAAAAEVAYGAGDDRADHHGRKVQVDPRFTALGFSS